MLTRVRIVVAIAADVIKVRASNDGDGSDGDDGGDGGDGDGGGGRKTQSAL